tara:strand:+ start:2873 stop:3160 length:288 start_codon:yes stop_codon:yes gene_type:complete
MSEYYKFYLTLHQNPKCRLLHFVGLWFTILYVGAVVFNGSWLALLLAPLVVYPFAWVGHSVFEKNKPAAFNNPIKAKIADWIMFKDILLRRLSIW